MTIKTKYNRGDRVLFYSDDYQKDMKGEIKSIVIDATPNNTVNIDYEIYADEIIKASNRHDIPEKNVKGGSFIIRKIK